MQQENKTIDMRYEVDFLVVGSGIAGLSFALKVAEHGRVCILTKGDAAEGSTRYAQGGIAAVMYTPTRSTSISRTPWWPVMASATARWWR